MFKRKLSTILGQLLFTKEAMESIAATTLQNVQDFVDGKPLVNEVTI